MSNTTKLLQLLESDCTLKPDQLSAMTGLSVQEVENTVRDLEERKTILGYQAIVDWNSTDRDDVTVSELVCQLQETGRGSLSRFVLPTFDEDDLDE